MDASIVLLDELSQDVPDDGRRIIVDQAQDETEIMLTNSPYPPFKRKCKTLSANYFSKRRKS